MWRTHNGWPSFLRCSVLSTHCAPSWKWWHSLRKISGSQPHLNIEIPLGELRNFQVIHRHVRPASLVGVGWDPSNPVFKASHMIPMYNQGEASPGTGSKRSEWCKKLGSLFGLLVSLIKEFKNGLKWKLEEDCIRLKIKQTNGSWAVNLRSFPVAEGEEINLALQDHLAWRPTTQWTSSHVVEREIFKKE